MARTRIVVATAEVVGDRMAGPAIRAWHLAEVLSREHDVELVTTATCARPDGGRFAVRHVAGADVHELVPRTDIWIAPPGVLLDQPSIEASEAVVVVDLYDPIHLEKLELSSGEPPADRLARVHNATVALNRAMRRGDLFLAASAKQRDFWLGALASLGRVNPLTYDEDPTLGTLVVLAPFGVDARAPEPAAAMRGVLPGIGADDVIALWGGGLYNWFDPQTLIRAVDLLRPRHPELRLVFLGGGHPNPRVPEMRVAAEARALAGGLGLFGSAVIFREEWVPYDERGAFLLEADIGVSTHLDHVETAFSFRTRILDYLWAGLPVVATEGDVFADVLPRAGAGIVVPPGDAPALAAAFETYLVDPAARRSAAAAARELARGYVWETALAPLAAFCRAPRRAPDLLDATVRSHLIRPFETVRAPTPGAPGWRGEVALARQYLADGGGALLARRAAGRAGKLLRGRTD